jgi:hypothetical protein
MANEQIVYDDVNVKAEQVYSMTGNSYHPFAPPVSLRDIYGRPTDFALLLTDYIRLDGSKELLILE